MKLKTLIFACGLCMVGANPVFARGAGDQGVGLALGAPTGFTMKFWMSDKVAIDGMLGVESQSLDIHADFLFHDFEVLKHLDFIKNQTYAEVPLYFGVGPRVRFEDKSEFGVRLPVGVACMPHQTPWEFYFEFVPVIRMTPSTGFNGDYGIGARYYFEAIRPR